MGADQLTKHWADFEQISVANPGEMIAEMCQASILSYELLLDTPHIWRPEIE